jgi:integrase
MAEGIVAMIANKLTASEVRGLREPGKYNDGNGLVLHIVTPTRRAWVFRYMRKGKARTMTLGSPDTVSLAEARDRRDAARRLLAEGIDPLDQRHAADDAGITFATAAARYIAAHETGWRNPKHRQQWTNTIETYARPVVGALDVSEIATDHVLSVLEPIWREKPETASRLRGRLETILSYATARGWRSGPNPAVWRGHLQLMLPAKTKVRKVEHHAALDWREAPAFVAKLCERDGMGVLAFRFAILTAVRSGEVRGAQWSEIDIERAVWTIPAERMKSGREHRVPLTESALAILRELADVQDGSGLVFFGAKRGALLSDMTLTAVLRRMARSDLTVHGFRSTFRDWAAEATSYPNHVVEMALAHTIGNAVEAAYRRGDLFEKRIALMNDWAAYLAKPPAKVLRPRFGQSLATGEVVA